MTKIMLIKDRNTFNTKWVCNFASQLVERGYEVVLVSDSLKHSGYSVPISEKVKKINLSPASANPLHNLWITMRRFLPVAFYRYRRLFATERPDVIICYFTHDLINATWMQNHQIPIIMMMHNPPNEVFANVRRGLNKYLTDYGFKHAAVIQVLMHSFVKEINEVYPHKEVVVIPNQVPMPPQQKDMQKINHTIIHVAQIARTFKRQHVLIEAFAKIAADFPEWKVHFFGRVKKGKHEHYYNELITKIRELGLQNQLIFKGYSDNITAEYLQSDIVTLPSFSEGFGYGLADGLALGLPGVGFADAPAINELIIDGKTGFLVQDVNDYADKLALLMRNQGLRAQFGAAAKKDMERYSPQNVVDKWVQLIKKVTEHD